MGWGDAENGMVATADRWLWFRGSFVLRGRESRVAPAHVAANVAVADRYPMLQGADWSQRAVRGER